MTLSVYAKQVGVIYTTAEQGWNARAVGCLPTADGEHHGA
jgi:hypothetical protein